MTSNGATNKPFSIEKRRVYEAYKAVKSNRGAAGVDGQTLEMFETDLAGNLYKIWNRMSSGAYFPPPVRAVSIPKKTGGERILGGGVRHGCTDCHRYHNGDLPLQGRGANARNAAQPLDLSEFLKGRR